MVGLPEDTISLFTNKMRFLIKSIRTYLIKSICVCQPVRLAGHSLMRYCRRDPATSRVAGGERSFWGLKLCSSRSNSEGDFARIKKYFGIELAFIVKGRLL
jgi:hypothetical protein